MQVQPVVGARVAIGFGGVESGLHFRALLRPEPDRLEIREAPPDFAEPRIGGERAAIGGDAVVLPPDRLQHMAIAHPELGMIGEAARQLLVRSEEQTSELQSLMRISSAVFCLKKKKT